MLGKTKDRLTSVEQTLTNPSKVDFNHVFKEILRNKELLALSKAFKDLSCGKDPNSEKSSHKQSFAAQPQPYMQVTQAWSNKNKPG